MPSHPPTLSQLQMSPSELSPSLSQAMGFSTFGSKPHLAKKRKRDGLLDADRTGSNSLLQDSQREGGVGVDVAVGTHLSENGEDGDGRMMEVGEDNVDGGEYRNNEDEDIRQEARNEHMVIGAGESAQTSTLGTERLMRLSERKILPVAPTVAAATNTEVHHDTADLSHKESSFLKTTKATPMIESESGYNFAALRHGVRNQNGDMAYYDHSFVEDPWKELRRKNTLSSTTP